jgi:phage gp36-like protein
MKKEARENILKKFSHIENQVHSLITQNQLLTESLKEALQDKQKLEEEYLKCKKMLENSNEVLNYFYNQIEIFRIAKSLSSETGFPDKIRKKIDDSIAEIDSCIQLLSE